jgi:hypothetical protein
LQAFAVALWNGRDPILKERLFGLTRNEGNRGEDVKECGLVAKLLQQSGEGEPDEPATREKQRIRVLLKAPQLEGVLEER